MSNDQSQESVFEPDPNQPPVAPAAAFFMAPATAPRRSRGILKTFLIAAIIDACLPLIAILWAWRDRGFFDNFGFAISTMAYQADNVFYPLLHGPSLQSSPFTLQDFDYLWGSWYPFYLPPLACGLVAFATSFALAQRRGCSGPGVIANLLASCAYLSSTLLICLIAVPFDTQLTGLVPILTADGQLTYDLGAKYGYLLPFLLLYVAMVGILAIGLGSLLAWLGGLLGKKTAQVRSAHTP